MSQNHKFSRNRRKTARKKRLPLLDPTPYRLHQSFLLCDLASLEHAPTICGLLK